MPTNPYDAFLPGGGGTPGSMGANPYDQFLPRTGRPVRKHGLFEDYIKPGFEAVKSYATPATALRLGLPIAGGIIGSALPGPGTLGGAAAGSALGAALGGGLGEYGAEKLEGVDNVDPGEVALSAGLAAIPAGPFGMAAAKPGLGLLARAGLHVAEGASQGVLAAGATSLYREGRLPTGKEIGGQAAAGGALGGILGLGLERLLRSGKITSDQANSALEANGQQRMFSEARPRPLADPFSIPPTEIQPSERFKVPPQPEQPAQRPLQFAEQLPLEIPIGPDLPPPHVPPATAEGGQRLLDFNAPTPEQPEQGGLFPGARPQPIPEPEPVLAQGNRQQRDMLQVKRDELTQKIAQAQADNRPPEEIAALFAQLEPIRARQQPIERQRAAVANMDAAEQTKLDLPAGEADPTGVIANLQRELTAQFGPVENWPDDDPRLLRIHELIDANGPHDPSRLARARGLRLEEDANTLRALGWDDNDLALMNSEQRSRLVQDQTRKPPTPEPLPATDQQGWDTVRGRVREKTGLWPNLNERTTVQQLEIERLGEIRDRKLAAEQVVGVERAKSLRALGWQDADIAQIPGPMPAQDLIDGRMRPHSGQQNQPPPPVAPASDPPIRKLPLTEAPPPPEEGFVGGIHPAPEGIGVLPEGVKRQMERNVGRIIAGNEPDLIPFLEKVVKDLGIHVRVKPGDQALKWLNPGEAAATGGGDFAGANHDAFLLGRATKGEFAGNDVVLRVGHKAGMPIQERFMIPLLAEGVVGRERGGVPVQADIVPFAIDHRNLAKVGVSHEQFHRDMRVLHNHAKAKGHVVRDLAAQGGFGYNDGNAGYIFRDGAWEPVVTDFGAVHRVNDPERMILRQEPAKGALPTGAEETTVPPNAAEEAAKGRFQVKEGSTVADLPTPKEVIRLARRDPASVGKPQVVSGLPGVIQRITEAIGRGREAGVRELESGVAYDFDKKSYTSLVGSRLNLDRLHESLAFLSRINRAPFEVFHILARDRMGNILEHFAWTSGEAGIVNVGSPEIAAQLKRLQADADVSAIHLMHNHPGGSAEPSTADIEHFFALKERMAKVQSEVIINHKNYAVIDSTHKTRARGFGKDYLDELGQTDPIFKTGELVGQHTMGEPGDPTLHPGTRENMNPTAILARLAKSTFGNEDAPRAVFLSNTGTIRGLDAIPLSVLADHVKASDYLRAQAARVGGKFVVLVHEPADALSAQHFQAFTNKLVEQNSVHFGISVDKEGVSKIDPNTRRAGMAFGQKSGNPAERVMEGPVTGRAPGEEGYDAAKAAAQGVIQQGMDAIPPPVKPREGFDLTGAEERGRAKVEPAPVEAKPGGKPDVAINILKDAAGLPKDVQHALVERFREVNDQLARGKVKPLDEEQMVRDASRFFDGKSPEEVIAAFKKAGRPLNAPEMRAAWMVWRDKEADASRLRDAWIAKGKPLEGAEREAWEKGVAEATGYGMFFANKKTEAARILKALDMAKSGEIDPRLKFFGRLMAGLRQNGLTDKTVEQLVNIYKLKPEDFADALRTALKPGIGAKLLEFWKAGLVSGPATRIANVASNFIFRVTRDVENVIATGIDVARVAALGGERERFLGEATAAWAGYKAEMHSAWTDLLNERFGYKLEPLREGLGGTFEDTARANVGAISGKFGEFVRIPFKNLEVDDAFFKHLSAAQEVYRRAYRKAAKEVLAEKLPKSERTRRMSEIAAEMMDVVKRKDESPHYEKYVDQLQAIQDTYKRDTFQLPLESLGNAIQNITRNSKLASLILPFVKTPANIAKETVYRTPGAFLFKGYREKLAGFRKGGEAAGAAAEELAKTVMGTTVGASIAMAAYEGLFTGGGPADSKREAALRETGWQPYSIKVGDQYISYQRLEPLAGIIGLAADLAEGVKAGETTTPGQKAAKLVGAIQENLTNKTFLSGLEGFFTFWHDPQRYAKRFITQLEASAVPNIIGATARAVDPNFRRTDLGTAPLSKIPGVSKLLPAQKAPTGEERLRPGSAVERFLSPLARSEARTGPHAQVAAEMERVNFIPSSNTEYVTVGRKQVQLRDSESQLLENARARATQALARVVIDPTYQALPDNEGDPKWRYGRTTKRDVLEKVYRKHIDQARQRINPGVFRRLRTANP